MYFYPSAISKLHCLTAVFQNPPKSSKIFIPKWIKFCQLFIRLVTSRILSFEKNEPWWERMVPQKEDSLCTLPGYMLPQRNETHQKGTSCWVHGKHFVVLAAGNTFQRLHRHQKSIQQCGKVLQAVSASCNQCNRLPGFGCCPKERLEHRSELERLVKGHWQRQIMFSCTQKLSCWKPPGCFAGTLLNYG